MQSPTVGSEFCSYLHKTGIPSSSLPEYDSFRYQQPNNYYFSKDLSSSSLSSQSSFSSSSSASCSSSLGLNKEPLIDHNPTYVNFNGNNKYKTFFDHDKNKMFLDSDLSLSDQEKPEKKSMDQSAMNRSKSLTLPQIFSIIGAILLAMLFILQIIHYIIIELKDNEILPQIKNKSKNHINENQNQNQNQNAEEYKSIKKQISQEKNSKNQMDQKHKQRKKLQKEKENTTTKKKKVNVDEEHFGVEQNKNKNKNEKIEKFFNQNMEIDVKNLENEQLLQLNPKAGGHELLRRLKFLEKTCVFADSQDSSTPTNANTIKKNE